VFRNICLLSAFIFLQSFRLFSIYSPAEPLFFLCCSQSRAGCNDPPVECSVYADYIQHTRVHWGRSSSAGISSLLSIVNR
jgi:hypothetical protein